MDEALNLREKDGDFIAYRRYYRELRDAWAKGTHNEDREKDVLDVTRELTRRYPAGGNSLDNPSVWSQEIGIKATLGAEAGFEGSIGPDLSANKLVSSAKAGIKAGVEADLGKVTVALPNWIRNWLVETFQFRSHTKILLRIALAQHRSDYLFLGLRRLWYQERSCRAVWQTRCPRRNRGSEREGV